jgi:hypothetical protein
VWLVSAVGADNEDSAYVWARNVSGSTDWQQLSKISDTEVNSWFGAAVALSESAMEFVIGGQFHTAILAFYHLQRAVHDACLRFARGQRAMRSTHT